MVALALAGAGACLGSAQEAPHASSSMAGAVAAPASRAVSGLKAETMDQETRLAGGRVSWSTRWRMCWAPVPGAVGYVVTQATPEGVGPPADTVERCVAMTLAHGVGTRPRDGTRRSSEVAFADRTVSLMVAARFGDGSLGPMSPAIAVGSTYP